MTCVRGDTISLPAQELGHLSQYRSPSAFLTMVVLPRRRGNSRYGGNEHHYPDGPYSYPPDRHRTNNGGEAYHGHRSSRVCNQQSILLLLVGIGLGYLVAMNVSTPGGGGGVGLDVIVKNIQRQNENQRSGTSSMVMEDMDAEPLSSPMNTISYQHREAAALLRSDISGHRRASFDDVDEDSTMTDSLPNTANKHHTFQEDNDEDQDLSAVQQRFVETQKLLSAQSIPTATNPHVMITPYLPDSKRKKILITGGAGFVGSHLTDKLMMEGHEVIVLDNFFTGQRKNVEHWMHHPRFQLVVHDVTEPIMLEVDEIYHLACPASPPHYQYNPVKTIKTSTMGTINMLGLAHRTKAKILLTSTSEIYGDPQVHPQPESYWGNVNPIGPRACYDEGKRVAETMMYAYKTNNGVDVRVARIFNTFGPRMHPNDGRVVSNFVIQSLQDKPLTIYGDGSQTRSFQYVSDLVDGLFALMNGGYDLPVNLGNPDEYTVKDFASYIKEITGSSSEISFLPATQDDPTQRKPDITTAKRELGWEPKVTVKEGLEKTIAYFSRVLEESGEIIPTGQEASRPKPKIVEPKATRVQVSP